jgi:transcriptional regulator with XRE-family HTH domain
MSPIEIFILNLKGLMLQHSINTAALSLSSGVSKRMIDYILNNQRNPSIEIIGAIAHVFDLKAWEMLHPTLGVTYEYN